MNAELRRLQENMVELINSFQLPTEAKRLVVCEILHKLEEQANKEIMYEIQETKEETKGEQGDKAWKKHTAG